MKLKIIDGNKLILPCVPGDKYYTIEPIQNTSREIRYDAWSGQSCIMENAKTVGKEIVEHTWGTYADIVKALEVGRVGKNIFLKKEDAERKSEKYWEPSWRK